MSKLYERVVLLDGMELVKGRDYQEVNGIYTGLPEGAVIANRRRCDPVKKMIGITIHRSGITEPIVEDEEVQR